MNKNSFKFLLTAIIPITLIGCNKTTPTYTSTILSVKPAAYEDLIINGGVKPLKNAGFKYGDLIKFTFKNTDGKEFTGTAPFVSNCTQAGMFNLAICDYEKAGSILSISFGDSTLYDEINQDEQDKYINQEIVFTLEKSGAWEETYDTVGLSKKRTYNFIGRDNNVFTNTRDIKTIAGNLKNSEVGFKTIYRMSSPFDNLQNIKRYGYADDIVCNLLKYNGKYTLLVDLNYNDFIDYNKSKFSGVLGSKWLIKGFTGKEQEAADLGFTNGGNGISVNIGDNFFSETNKEKIKKVITNTDKKGIIDYLTGKTAGTYQIIFCDAEGIERTGFFTLLLEALAGANYETLVSDYMVSYKDYYNILPYEDTKNQYELIKKLSVDRILYGLCAFQESTFKETKWNEIDVAYNYLKEKGKADASATFVDEAEKYIKYLFDDENEATTIINQLKKIVKGEAINA